MPAVHPLQEVDERGFAAEGAPDAPASQAELWDALVSGRWVLVDCREDAGLRRLLLRRSERPRSLTPREREVVRRVAVGEANKSIAIDLRVSSSAVARTLARALRKLSLRTRMQVVRLLPGSAALPPR